MSEQLVGREEELQVLELFLVAARREPRALVIEGEAGVGKTSLWEAALRAASADGAQRLSARPTEAEASFAYAALGDLLHDHAEVRATLPPRQRRALEVALLLSEEEVDSPDAQSVALAVLGMVERLATERPLVVAVDDVQWLDAPSAAALSFATRRLRNLPVALVLAWRTDGGEPLPLDLGRAPIGGTIERLAVSPLSLGAVQRLLQQRLDYLPPRPALRRLHELSGGNPFFALELGRVLRAGTLQLEPGERLPIALEALVGSRLAALSPDAQRALAAAATLAQPTLALAGSVAGSGRAALDEAERADVIAVRDGRIRFTHPLLASGAYAAVDPSIRRELHAAAAAAVTDPEERARHRALAATGPDDEVASELEAAAGRADARGAPAAAADLYERAMRLTPPTAVGDALRRKLHAGFCTFRSGDGHRGRTMLEEVVASLDAGPERAQALISLGRVRSYDDDIRAAEVLFRQALDEAGEDHTLRAAAGENLSAILFRLRERLEEAVEHAAMATSAADAAGDTGWLSEAHGARLLSEAALGRREAVGTLELALSVQRECESRRAIAQPLFQVGVVWLWWDELDRAKEAFEWLTRRAREMGDEASLPYLLVLASQTEVVRGDLVLAAAHADEGCALAQQIGQETLVAYLLALRAVVNADAGEAEQCRELAGRALDLAAQTSGRPAEHFALAALGRVELSLGRAAEAAEVLGPFVQFLRREQIREPGTARVVPDQIEALVALGRLDEADELLCWYAANAAALRRASALAATARCRGLLRAERGDLEGALADLGEAVDLRAPVPLEHGRSLLALGAAQRRARQKRAAREALEQAQACFEELGASVWADRASDELSRVGGRAPSSGELTAAERRVAELVAEGLQTKQVAAALFVSPKTVEGHLTHIYAKLGVHSRTELARRLTVDWPAARSGRSIDT